MCPVHERSARKWGHAHGQRQTAAHEQRESAVRHSGGLGAHHRYKLALEVLSRMALQDLRDVGRGNVPDAQPGTVDHRTPLQVAAKGSVALDGDARRRVNTDRVREEVCALVADPGCGCAGGRSLCACEREVAPRGRLGDAVVVQQRAAVEQLGVELDAVDSGERAPEQPGPIGVADERRRQLGACLLGLTREQRVRRRERLEIDFRGARREPSERQLRATEDVFPLAERDRREQPTALAGAQPPFGASCPAQASEPLWIDGDRDVLSQMSVSLRRVGLSQQLAGDTIGGLGGPSDEAA